MELFIGLLVLAVIGLFIYIPRVEALAINNRGRIARLEVKGLDLYNNIETIYGVNEYGMKTTTIRDARTKCNMEKESIKVDFEKVYKHDTSILQEENKSLSFQLSEVSRALQEKKNLIYDMDKRMSELDAFNCKLTLELAEKSTGLANACEARDRANIQYQSAFGLLEQVNKLYQQLLKEKPVNLNTASMYVFGMVEDFIGEFTKIRLNDPKYQAKPVSFRHDRIDFTRQFEGQWLDSLGKDATEAENLVGEMVDKEPKIEESEIYQCERCGKNMTSADQAPYNQFSQIDFNCCKECYND